MDIMMEADEEMQKIGRRGYFGDPRDRPFILTGNWERA
jgi:hypothetical protein